MKPQSNFQANFLTNLQTNLVPAARQLFICTVLLMGFLVSIPEANSAESTSDKKESDGTVGKVSMERAPRANENVKNETRSETAQNNEPDAATKKVCESHFPSRLQEDVRQACYLGMKTHKEVGKAMGLPICKTTYPESHRQVSACQLALAVADDQSKAQENYQVKLKLCQDQYPPHNQLDYFLQESCLTGVHLPALTEKPAKLELCSQVSSERSFIGPCAVGLSLSSDTMAADAAINLHNKFCTQFFNIQAFHTGYRACVNARSLSLNWTGRFNDILRDCKEIVSDNNSDTEKAACIVGVSIFQNIQKSQQVSSRFVTCGDNKVSYQDRDFLACLTAASLLDFSEKKIAKGGCGEIFSKVHTKKKRRSKKKGVEVVKATAYRENCMNSLELFN